MFNFYDDECMVDFWSLIIRYPWIFLLVSWLIFFIRPKIVNPIFLRIGIIFYFSFFFSFTVIVWLSHEEDNHQQSTTTEGEVSRHETTINHKTKRSLLITMVADLKSFVPSTLAALDLVMRSHRSQPWPTREHHLVLGLELSDDSYGCRRRRPWLFWNIKDIPLGLCSVLGQDRPKNV